MKTMGKIDDIFIKNLPTIDLHGYDRDSARVATVDFVDEACLMGWREIVIIHGIGSGIVKQSVQEALAHNHKVVNYYIYGSNIGCTVVHVDCNQERNLC